MFSPFKKTYSNKEINFFRYLSRMYLFEKLSYKELSYFTSFFYLREYRGEEVIFFRNDPSNALYLLKSGKVTLAIDNKDGFERLITLKSGELFGENCLLNDKNRIHTSIIISEKAELYVLPKVNIDEIFEHHKEVKTKMLESLAEHLNDYQAHIVKGYLSASGFFSMSLAYKS